MNYQKGFAAITVLLVVLGLLVLGGGGYVAMNPDVLQKFTGTVAHDNDQVHLEGKSSIAWSFESAGEVDAIPQTKVSVAINGVPHEVGTFSGSCSEIGANGGVDGKGLLAGELSAAQCWYAGGGDEIGVFAHEDGGFDILVGALSEGEEGAGMFRGDFKVKTSIEL